MEKLSTQSTKDKFVSKYQGVGIIAIFVLGIFTPLIIISSLALKFGNDLFGEHLAYLIYQSLGLMITVFIPVIAIDSVIYDKTSKKINYITVLSAITSFYLFLMFGSLRSWLTQMYIEQSQTGLFTNSVNQIVGILWKVGIVFLVIAVISILSRNKFKEQESNKFWRNRNILYALFFIVVIALITFFFLAYNASINPTYNPDYGSLIGGALGGIGTLVAVFFTLKHNQITEGLNRHDAIRPYIKAWHLNGAVSEGYSINFPKYDFVYSPEEKQFLKKVKFADLNDMLVRELIIENIGQGIATDLVISFEDDNGGLYGTNDIIALGVGKTEIYRFIIRKDFLKVGKYRIILDYQDVMRKKYFQQIELEIENDPSQDTGMNLKDFLKTSHQEERTT